jgi:hypothetical protein
METKIGFDDTSPNFVTDFSRAEYVLHDALVFLFEGTIGTGKQLVPLLKIAHEQDRPLLVIAGNYEPNAIATMVKNKPERHRVLRDSHAPLMCPLRRCSNWRRVSKPTSAIIADVIPQRPGKGDARVPAKSQTPVLALPSA